MTRPLPQTRTASRMAGGRIPAYAAFALCFAFASAVVLGLIG